MNNTLKTDDNGNSAIHQRLLTENPASQETLDLMLEVLNNPNININQGNDDGLRYIDLIMMHKELCRNLTENSLFLKLKERSDLYIGPNKFGDTPIHYAAHADNFSGLIFLNHMIGVNFYVNTKNDLGLTPLHIAATGMKLRSIITLRKILNAKPNLQDAEGDTPAHRLIISLCAYPDTPLEDILLLLKASADLELDFSIRNNKSLSAVGIAVKNMSIATFDALMLTNKSLDINNPETLGCYPLHLAVTGGDIVFARHLISSGIDLPIRNEDGFTAKELMEQNAELAESIEWIDLFANTTLNTTHSMDNAEIGEKIEAKLEEMAREISEES